MYRSTPYFLFFKAANVLYDEKGNIKLADFGISKWLNNISTVNDGTALNGAAINPASAENNTECVGSVYWMAPEVIRGDRYARRADIW